MGLAHLLKKQGTRLLVSLLALVWVTVLPTMILIFSPFYIYRLLIQFYTHHFRKDLGGLVSVRSSLLAVDDMEGKPECNVVIWFVLEGEVLVSHFQKFFTASVLTLKNEVSGDLAYPELQQHYHREFGYLFWKWDPSFQIENHIKDCDEWHGATAVREEEVLKLNEKLLSQPWPSKRSPWEFLLVNNYHNEEKNDTNRTLVLFHLHHGMGDGYSFLKMIQNHMVGEKRGKTARPKDPPRPSKVTWSNLTLPFRIAYDFSKQSISYDLNYWHSAGKKLTRNVRVGKTSRIPVPKIKHIKNKYQVSFSAVLFSATAGGIRKYFLDRSLPVPDSMRVFLPLPFPNHPDDKLTNHLTGVFIKLPTGKATARDRVLASHAYFESLRGSTLPLSNFYLSLLGGALPVFMSAINKNYHCTGIFSNFPGDEESEVLMIDRKIEDFSYNVGYLHGHAGFTFTALTYQNDLRIDLAIDEALAPEKDSAQLIVENIAQEFDNMWRLDVARG